MDAWLGQREQWLRGRQIQYGDRDASPMTAVDLACSRQSERMEISLRVNLILWRGDVYGVQPSAVNEDPSVLGAEKSSGGIE